MSEGRRRIRCPQCGAANVQISVVQDSFSTKGSGCLWTIGRWLLIICTCGLWLLIGKHKSKSKMKSRKEAVCQSCGYSWKIK